MDETVHHTGPIWVWRAQEKGSWHFITIDGEAGEALTGIALMRKFEFGRRAGFGSLKVLARIGESEWNTSVFPDKKRGWLLPVKAAIRRAENLVPGDEFALSVTPL
ncbi:DUF1905 domain-containing protein [uncultured Erythrobacter sp.]|uniref:DUF1905 domain-containing protein n=1 Tax=uncultured Erythrobacter sp. TaxID=263913 RepID=UPI002638FD2E|nr:DUF1905 domain-containing protein [uncultured Erythrobacter sp.]